MSWKDKKPTQEQAALEYPVTEYVPTEIVPDRAQIATILAHALMTRPGAMALSAIPKQAVELADQLLAELKGESCETT